MDRAEELFRRHANELFGYLCRFTANRADAEDILSDVFMKMLEQGEQQLAVEGFEWRPWLFRVATNSAISRFRQQRIRALFTRKGAEQPAPVIKGNDPVETIQDAERVRAAIRSLRPKLKTVLIMRVYQDLSYEEIAAAAGINVGTVKSRLNEAKRQLKELLGEG